MRTLVATRLALSLSGCWVSLRQDVPAAERALRLPQNQEGALFGSDLLRAFPDRSVWIVDAPSLTLRGYQVVEGPYKPGDLAARKTAP